MSPTPRILGFAGSTRTDSYNKKLIRIASEGARAVGAEVTLLDLRDIPLPIYDADTEKSEGLPSNAKRFKDLCLGHQGFLISSPEYNSSIPGVLKNAIDWASRPAQGEAELACFIGKVAGLVSASPGKLGGLRGLVTLRSILGNIGVLVVANQVAVPLAAEAFDTGGQLKDPAMQAAVRKVGSDVAELLKKVQSVP